MEIPLQITFHEMFPSDAVRDLVRRRAARLDELYNRIMGCRVVIEAPHRQHRHGNHYRVRVDLTVPGEELVVGRDPPANTAHEDLFVAINDVFRAAQRQLQDYVHRRRGYVKNHGGAT